MTPALRALIEDVEWLLESGEHPGNIVPRVGKPSSNALSRSLARAGRPDLARPFYRLRHMPEWSDR